MIRLPDKPIIETVDENTTLFVTHKEIIDGEETEGVRKVKVKALSEELKYHYGYASSIVLPSEKANAIQLTDTKKAPLVDYQIYGNSAQDGTPTPNNPVEINSVGTIVTDETSEHYGKYEIPVTVYGKNIALLNLLMDASAYSGKITDNADGSITVAAGENKSASYINIRANSKITFKNDATVTISCVGANSNVYLSITATIGGVSNPAIINSSTKSVTYTVSKGDSVRLFLQCPPSQTVTNSITVYPQLEFSSKATEYEQFIEPITYNIYLDEPLRRIPKYYSGEESDIYDYIDFKKGVVVRNIAEGSVPTTGNNFDWNSGNGRRYIFTLSNKKYGSSITTVGHFNLGTVKQNVSGGVNSNTLQAYSGSSGLYWHLDFSVCGLDGTEEKAVAEAAFRNWLKTVDTTFTYVLKTPTETKVNFPEIIANYPTTTILCGSEIQVVYEADTTNAYNNLKSELDIIKRAIIELGGME